MSDKERDGIVEKAAKSDRVSLNILVRGAEKTFDNAERLFVEAELLAKAGAVARALCLHQISLEECSKVDSLGAWAVSLVVGFDVDQKKVLSAFARHASKNKSNAYMLKASEAESEARLRGDWDGAMAAFKDSQEAFHERSNQAKNASLYVDWIDGEFAAPSERISKEMLAEITERNAEFLGNSHNSLKMLRRLEESPDKMRGLLSGFVEQVEKLREEKQDNPMEAMEALLSSFLEAGMRELKG
ncbi:MULTISPECIES: AbiV family abortive infection protein [unclassified Mesorhizobium]|uniref:AbiV family abortive infection protein n=5 Tax=Mesorhizobium TaxID=68287 RepID=UPI000F762B57|nr:MULTISPECIES: AbiV family abortive infection protein [unclassified Mesorhizobium]TGP56595.1 AbiV family abortive infection protein [bacterium M00.F.Ca.ET.230.01.1.1]TGP74947.1 AbiV family abortive infection protein [bacterium M00.F.Ca.ET.227.01.1.1]TGP85274.1 AbiV family abortive infection protein [bacterium M00.F.Ca.ET.221.01.1.1]TGP89700.1 AbiV family abortive infection protein [bacterium M00.F.Ca.ET.222.01.1.1]TGT67799.1 AbiV family abortive infection protein [bacterium M00.F.Ca.ET.159.0